MPAWISRPVRRLHRASALPTAGGARMARISVILLVFLLAFAQQAAVVHALAHIAGLEQPRGAQLAPGAASDHRSGDLDAYCDKCYQFAHLSGIAFGHLADLALPGAVADRALAALRAGLSADPPRAQSRGPPAAL